MPKFAYYFSINIDNFQVMFYYIINNEYPLGEENE